MVDGRLPAEGPWIVTVGGGGGAERDDLVVEGTTRGGSADAPGFKRAPAAATRVS